MPAKTVLTKVFSLEAAHFLPHVPEGHKCKNIHGHSFKIAISVSGSIDPYYGWIVDYADLSKAFKPIHEQLDHKLLNDIKGLENPTSENLAHWILNNFQISGAKVYSISVDETCSSSCTVYME